MNIMIITAEFILAIYCLFDVSAAQNDEENEELTFTGIFALSLNNIKQGITFIGVCNVLLRFVQALSHWRIWMLRFCIDIFVLFVSTILLERFRQIANRIEILIERGVGMSEKT